MVQVDEHAFVCGGGLAGVKDETTKRRSTSGAEIDQAELKMGALFPALDA